MESIDNAFGTSHSNVWAKVLHFAKHFFASSNSKLEKH